MTTLPVLLKFEDIELQIIDHDHKPWLTAADLARALGYADPRSVTKIFKRNEDEFEANMTLVVNLTTRGAVADKPVRIFSPRGCHLIGMLAKTVTAKAFRRWVLDVLDGFSFQSAPRVETVSQQQMQEMTNRVRNISERMRFKDQAAWAAWAAWERLRKAFGVSPISKLPAARYDDAMAILKEMEQYASGYGDWMIAVENRFRREVLRCGVAFDDMDKQMDKLPTPH